MFYLLTGLIIGGPFILIGGLFLLIELIIYQYYWQLDKTEQWISLTEKYDMAWPIIFLRNTTRLIGFNNHEIDSACFNPIITGLSPILTGIAILFAWPLISLILVAYLIRFIIRKIRS